ncbi:hypothetical protein F5X68DRAFT_227636 [Plectosphaerella plurivora]|uniref:Uncharacterized protein n=1 Tax=Plectosphaerella plurivora TaxID=936078 RepID=A0A9P8VLF8_9PEZI|nr:hypothetical protein F5X68DRAFT_227636 [Plectosphaerella plurivora]
MSPNNDITFSIQAHIGELPLIGDSYSPAYGKITHTTIFKSTGPAGRSPSLAFAACGDDLAAPVKPQHPAPVEAQHSVPMEPQPQPQQAAPVVEGPSHEEQVLSACTKTMNSYLNGLDYSALGWRRRARTPASAGNFPCWSSRGMSSTTALRGPKKLSKKEVNHKDMAKNHQLAKIKAKGSNDTLEDVVIRSWSTIKNLYALDSKSGRHILVLASWIEFLLLQLNLCGLTGKWRSSETGPCTLGPEPSPLSLTYLFEQAMMSSSEDFMQGAIMAMRSVAIKYFEKIASSVELDSD